MKVLFAVSNDNITTSVVNKYQQKFKEIITTKNVYYFNAIIKELQRDKSYDSIVIGEDLEPISNNNYTSIDKFLYEKLDGISDEATKPSGADIPIIFICSDRRTISDELLTELYGIGIYNAIIGRDRSIDMVCNLINKPRSKREAKDYYRITPDKKIGIGPGDETIEKDVSESEIQNIISHYKKIGTNIKKCVESFDSIADQYNESQLRVIIKFLPSDVKEILEHNSGRFQKLISNGTVLSDGTYKPYERQNPRKPGSLDFLAKDLEKTKMSKPVVIPSSIRFSKPSGNNMMTGANMPLNNNMIQPQENQNQTNFNNNGAQPINNNYNGMSQPINNNYSGMTQPINNNYNEMSQPMNNNYSETAQPMNNNQVNNQGIPELPKKRGRGRPRKIDVASATGSIPQHQDMNGIAQPANVAPKRKRGRPPKQTVVPTPVTGQFTTTTPIEEQISNQMNDVLPENDVLPGLEENDDYLFNMDSTSNAEQNLDPVVLPGFDNDIENVEINNDNSADTNLFDLDIENDNQQSSINNSTTDELNDLLNNNFLENTNNDVNNDPYSNIDLFGLDDGSSNTSANTFDSNVNTNTFDSNVSTNNFDNEANTSFNNYTNNFNNNDSAYGQNAYNQPPITNGLTETNSYQPNVQQNVVAGNGKVVAFVGTTKNGTSFIVNNLAQLLSQNGIKTAILDLTKNKNSYYMFTDNDAGLMKKATDSIKNLSNGVVDGLNVNKNLTVFTSLPDGLEEVNNNNSNMITTLSSNFDIALLDCDFETSSDYFTIANEIYLVQTMDTFTIQPLTQFLSDLKLKNMLDESKLRVVLNKYVKLKRLDENLIIGGMSKYNEPSMTLQRDLFNAQTIQRVLIPFELETYAKYLESIAMCNLSLNGYSQNFLRALEELKNMVYPLISGGNNRSQYNTQEKNGLFGGRKNKAQTQTTQFSNNVNDTLNRMRTNNF